MSTLRFFVNNNRVSTAVVLKDGSVLQVYPGKQKFGTSNDWENAWRKRSEITIRVESTGVVKNPPAEVAPLKMTPSIPEEFLDLKNWNYTDIEKKTLPPGEYYIGDLCYALDQSVYDKIFGGHGYESGYYEHKDGRFFVNNTAWGDGEFIGSDGKSFPVDAGIIGICSSSLYVKAKVYGGHIYTFTQPVVCDFRNGKFRFESGSQYLKINTN
jgi:hypothetical protein